MLAFISGLQQLCWNPLILSAFMGTGLYFSIKSGFLQVTKPIYIFKHTLGQINKGEKSDGISPLAALSAALAACMGTGNIIGVASALCLGGPGSVFWMILSAILGEMTSCAENILGILHREKNTKNEWVGGSMLYIEKAFKSRKAATFFSFCCIAASLGMGNMTQANALGSCATQITEIYPPALGIGLACICAMIILGGIKRISAITEKIIPLLSIVTIAALMAIVIKNRGEILPCIRMIISNAFNFKSAAGGAAGYTAAKAVKFGIARGVFSNEAGLGSSPIVHAAANVNSPVEQGLWGITEVFIDTVLMCTLTALALLTSGAFKLGTIQEPMQMCLNAFANVFGSGAKIFLCTTLSIFAFATIIGWAYYGEKAAEYALGEKAVTPYRIIYLACTALGVCASLESVWALSDIFNALMAVPNLLALWKLRKQAVNEMNKIKKHGCLGHLSVRKYVALSGNRAK